jgi:hypothetical protein
MSTAPENTTTAVEPASNGSALDAGRRLVAAGAEAPAADHTEAQLRARIAMLERQLAEVAECLENAETRGAEVLSLRARVAGLDAKVAQYNATRSWRYTAPLRVVGGRLRRWLRR